MAYKGIIFSAIFVAISIFGMPLAFARSAHVEETHTEHAHEGEAGIAHQFEEILPFHHFAEGHIFAGIMLIIFWISFFYLLYSIFQMFLAKRKK